MSLMHPPPPWIEAMDCHLSAVKLVKSLLRGEHPAVKELRGAWERDALLLQNASPFGWTREPIAAVRALAEKIPADAVLNRWNLDSDAVFWWFEEPLSYQTLTDDIVTDGSKRGVRALSLGWIQIGQTKHFIIVAWCDAPEDMQRYRLTPSQVFQWQEGDTLEETLQKTRVEHAFVYGPAGPYYKRPQVGTDVFMDSAEKLARFVLAAMLWLDSKILVTHDEKAPRQMRRQLEREVERPVSDVKIINLRKFEYAGVKHEAIEGDARKYTCRWLVDGHMRNQACGPNFSQRKLIWIHPFVKGPDDAPLRVPRARVYRVER